MITKKSLSESPGNGAARNISGQEGSSTLSVGTARPPLEHKKSDDLLFHLSLAVSSSCCLLDHRGLWAVFPVSGSSYLTTESAKGSNGTNRRLGEWRGSEHIWYVVNYSLDLQTTLKLFALFLFSTIKSAESVLFLFFFLPKISGEKT